jgi:hypothetical protein
MNTLNTLPLIEVTTGDQAFYDFLKASFGPLQPVTSALMLSGLSDFRMLDMLPVLTFDASFGSIQVETNVTRWNEFFRDNISSKAIGQYVPDLERDSSGNSYVIYGNDAFLAEHQELLEPIDISSAIPLDLTESLNKLFLDDGDIESINSEILAGNVYVDNIDIGLPAGF